MFLSFEMVDLCAEGPLVSLSAPDFMQVAVPVDIAAQLSKLLLLAIPNEEFQPFLNGFFFSPATGGF